LAEARCERFALWEVNGILRRTDVLVGVLAYPKSLSSWKNLWLNLLGADTPCDAWFEDSGLSNERVLHLAALPNKIGWRGEEH